MNKDACVLVSGGIESSVLLNEALSHYDHVTPVYIRNHLRWEDTEIFCLKNFVRSLKQNNLDRKSTRLNSSHSAKSRMPSSA